MAVTNLPGLGRAGSFVPGFLLAGFGVDGSEVLELEGAAFVSGPGSDVLHSGLLGSAAQAADDLALGD